MNWNTYIIYIAPLVAKHCQCSCQLVFLIVNAIVLCIHVPSHPVHCSFLWRVLSLAVVERRAWRLCFAAAGFSQMGDVLWVWRLERRGIFRTRHYQLWTDRPVVICWSDNEATSNKTAERVHSYHTQKHQTMLKEAVETKALLSSMIFEREREREERERRERELVYMCVNSISALRWIR